MLTTAQVTRLTGLSLRQLQWWDERGYLKPSRVRLKVARYRRYTPEQIFRALLLREIKTRAFRTSQFPRLLKIANSVERIAGPAMDRYTLAVIGLEHGRGPTVEVFLDEHTHNGIPDLIHWATWRRGPVVVIDIGKLWAQARKAA
jgi:DNA-binding transcriptional MerR regulator